MVDGGPRLAWLEAIADRHSLSLHGVGMSIASDAPPDPRHLRRFTALVDRFAPALVSEHLAWAGRSGAWVPDLLPAPRDRATLAHASDNLRRVQDAIGRRIALENPSHYLQLPHSFGEAEFLAELVHLTGCGLLLDVNNVFVSARNLGLDPKACIDAFPGEAVMEIHLAGHRPDPALGEALLIDSHDAPVAEPVWELFERLVARIGPRPTLLERDGRLPRFDVLLEERDRADRVLRGERRDSAPQADVLRGVAPEAAAMHRASWEAAA